MTSAWGQIGVRAEGPSRVLARSSAAPDVEHRLGKTHLAIALGRTVDETGHSVLFTSATASEETDYLLSLHMEGHLTSGGTVRVRIGENERLRRDDGICSDRIGLCRLECVLQTVPSARLTAHSDRPTRRNGEPMSRIPSAVLMTRLALGIQLRLSLLTPVPASRSLQHDNPCARERRGHSSIRYAWI